MKFAFSCLENLQRTPFNPSFLPPTSAFLSPPWRAHGPLKFCLLAGNKKTTKTQLQYGGFFFLFLKKNIKHQETEQSACRHYTCIINKISLFIYKETHEELENEGYPHYI